MSKESEAIDSLARDVGDLGVNIDGVEQQLARIAYALECLAHPHGLRNEKPCTTCGCRLLAEGAMRHVACPACRCNTVGT